LFHKQNEMCYGTLRMTRKPPSPARPACPRAAPQNDGGPALPSKREALPLGFAAGRSPPCQAGEVAAFWPPGPQKKKKKKPPPRPSLQRLLRHASGHDTWMADPRRTADRGPAVVGDQPLAVGLGFTTWPWQRGTRQGPWRWRATLGPRLSPAIRGACVGWAAGWSVSGRGCAASASISAPPGQALAEQLSGWIG